MSDLRDIEASIATKRARVDCMRAQLDEALMDLAEATVRNYELITMEELEAFLRSSEVMMTNGDYYSRPRVIHHSECNKEDVLSAREDYACINERYNIVCIGGHSPNWNYPQSEPVCIRRDDRFDRWLKQRRETDGRRS